MALVISQHFQTYMLDNMDGFAFYTLHPSGQFSKWPANNFNKVPNNNVLVQISPGNTYDTLTTS